MWVAARRESTIQKQTWVNKICEPCAAAAGLHARAKEQATVCERAFVRTGRGAVRAAVLSSHRGRRAHVVARTCGCAWWTEGGRCTGAWTAPLSWTGPLVGDATLANLLTRFHKPLRNRRGSNKIAGGGSRGHWSAHALLLWRAGPVVKPWMVAWAFFNLALVHTPPRLRSAKV